MVSRTKLLDSKSSWENENRIRGGGICCGRVFRSSGPASISKDGYLGCRTESDFDG